LAIIWAFEGPPCWHPGSPGNCDPQRCVCWRICGRTLSWHLSI